MLSSIGNNETTIDQAFKTYFFRNTSTNTKFLELCAAKPLIFGLHGIWCSVRQLVDGNSGQLKPKDALAISRRYREIINAFTTLIGSSNNAVNSEIYNAETLWSLTESIYLTSADTSIVISLIAWGNGCFKDSNKLITECLNDSSEQGEAHDFYWNSVIHSIIQVNLSVAIRLLRKHSRFDKDSAIQQICFFLESFQTFLEQGLPNSSAFLSVQRKVRDALQAGTFKRSEQLTTIASLLIGKNEPFEKFARTLYENWYEILPSYALFTCPGATFENIGRIAQTLYNLLCPSNVHVSAIESLISDIDRPIFSILTGNLVQMLKQVCEKSNLWWFIVHFIDLLYHYDPALMVNLTQSFPELQTDSSTNRLDENNEVMSCKSFFSVHSAIVIDYGRALLNSQPYWIIASDYLNAISAKDLQLMGGEPNLDVKLDSVNKAEYIYAQAVKNNHLQTKERVARWFVTRYLNQDCLSEALCWALRSDLPELINLVSNKLLLKSNAESISQMRIFDAMAEQFYRYPSLLLLQRFYEFRRCLSQGQASEAASRIHELITAGNASISFQMVLFDQMTKLLDASNDLIQKLQLDTDAIYDLMKAVNKFQIQSSIIDPPELQKENPAVFELNTKIKFLRQALCNALAAQALL